MMTASKSSKPADFTVLGHAAVVPPATMRYRSEYRSQTGVVLLVVVMLVFLMVTLLAFMLEDQHLLMRRVSNQNVSEQGYQYAQAANAWAMRLLFEDADRTSDHRLEAWAKVGQPEQVRIDVEEGRFSLSRENAEEEEPLPIIDFGDVPVDFYISDLQGLYNLNNLSVTNPNQRATQQLIFYNLLEQIGVDDFELKEILTDSLIDWLDSNEEELPLGMESGRYASTGLPYYAADQPLSSLGELRFVNGFTPQIIADLESYVTVLPAANVPLNINAASAEVLVSLNPSPAGDAGALSGFLGLRSQPAFLGFTPADISLAEGAINNASPANTQGSIRSMLSASSQYFQVNVKVELGNSVYCMRTKIFRDATKASSEMSESMRILHREYDSLCLNHRPIESEVAIDLS